MADPLAVVERPCPHGWGGCDIYSGGHYCKKDADHPGRCVCVCGSWSWREGDNGG